MNNILIYQNENGNIKVDVKFEDETLWLSQTQICEVFGKAKSTISEHIKAIDFRVRSSTGTKFRIWAKDKLKEYITKGFVLDDDRFKNGNSISYFDELQKRLREIRLSEKFFYQKIKVSKSI